SSSEASAPTWLPMPACVAAVAAPPGAGPPRARPWVESVRPCLSLLRDGRVPALVRGARAAHQPARVAGRQGGERSLRGADQQSPPDALLGLDFDFRLPVRLDDALLRGRPGFGVVTKLLEAIAKIIQFQLASELFRRGAAASRAVAEHRKAGDRQHQRADHQLEDVIGLELRLEIEVALGAQLKCL